MKKVLILANDTTYTYNLRNEIIERLNEDGYGVAVACRALLLQKELQALGAGIIPVETDRHGKNPISDLLLLTKYLRIIKAEKPDVVLTYNIKPNVYGGIACQMAGIPYVANITGLGTPVEYPGVLQKISIRLYRAGVAKADCVFFQNEENRRFFLSHQMLPGGARVRMLPGSGVSLKIHKPMPYPQEGERINFLLVARVMKEKGIELYHAAAKRVYSTHPNVMFHICGKCEDEKYMRVLKEAEESRFISYHGEQRDMVPFFAMAHCIVHPSYYPEGMSNVLLEAAAHCRPIIASDRAGCRETVDDGKSGFVIPVKDEDALVDALERFLALNWTQRRDMGLAGRAKIEREFDRQIVVKAYMEEIERILG